MRSRNRLLGVLSVIALSAACEAGPGTPSGTDGNDSTDGPDGDGGSGASSSQGAANPGGAGEGGDGATSEGGAPPIDECRGNGDCDGGEICDDGSCVPGCADDAPCEGGLACCAGGCVDLATDLDHCGSCDEACEEAPNVSATCNGTCGFSACDSGFNNCNGSMVDGCETQGPCVCTPGATQSCYTGPVGTEGVGACQAGTETCLDSGTGWGACFGQFFPIPEICADSIDNNCDNLVDNVLDLDGDGWTTCDGDCCDEIGAACGTPNLVNPGAFEYPGNLVDDDCDAGTPDVTAALCSTTAKYAGVTPADVIQAIDLCQNTTLSAPLPTRKWGVISTEYRKANGAVPNATELSNMQNWQAAIITDYGNTLNGPQKGMTLAGLSTGRFRDVNDGGYVSPGVSGTPFSGTSVPPPAVYTSQHGNALPSSASCYGSCPAGSGAYDSIDVRAQIRVPTNALSFSYKFRFFSAEFWNWSCSPYNDFYLALLTSGHVGIPLDHNISFDSANNPVSVNNGFFDSCQVRGCQTCPIGSGPLANTGMNVTVFNGTYGNGLTGGATNWLTTTAPVIPGEVITIDFSLFDVSDQNLDSNVLLDQFEWSVTPSAVGTSED